MHPRVFIRTARTVHAASLVGVAAALALSTLSCAGPTATLAPQTASWAPHTSAKEIQLTVREKLAAHRRQEIDRLRAYAEAAQFPVNTPDVNQAHMFKDPQGRLCAVANLIHADGHDDVVDAVASANNGLVVAGLKAGPVVDWIRTSGLTQEEVARIQAPAPLVRRKRAPKADDHDVAAKPRMSEAQMVAALRTRFASVEAELEATTTASLDTAVERLVAND